MHRASLLQISPSLLSALFSPPMRPPQLEDLLSIVPEPESLSAYSHDIKETPCGKFVLHMRPVNSALSRKILMFFNLEERECSTVTIKK